MENQNAQKYLGIIILVLVIAGGVFLLKTKEVNAPVDDTKVEIGDVTNTTPVGVGPVIKQIVVPTNLTPEQKELLTKLQQAVKAKDYEAFGDAIFLIYENGWGKVSDFEKTESEFYMYAYDTYFAKGDLENALRVSTIVYRKASQAWRFRYLRILTLEKYGRNAFEAGDLVKAESYANTILQMMFRPEGANLLADVYISKINTNIKDGNTNLAKQNLGFIWDYEVSADRRVTLTTLKSQLGL